MGFSEKKDLMHLFLEKIEIISDFKHRNECIIEFDETFYYCGFINQEEIKLFVNILGFKPGIDFNIFNKKFIFDGAEDGC